MPQRTPQLRPPSFSKALAAPRSQYEEQPSDIAIGSESFHAYCKGKHCAVACTLEVLAVMKRCVPSKSEVGKNVWLELTEPRSLGGSQCRYGLTPVSNSLKVASIP